MPDFIAFIFYTLFDTPFRHYAFIDACMLYICFSCRFASLLIAERQMAHFSFACRCLLLPIFFTRTAAIRDMLRRATHAADAMLRFDVTMPLIAFSICLMLHA